MAARRDCLDRGSALKFITKHHRNGLLRLPGSTNFARWIRSWNHILPTLAGLSNKFVKQMPHQHSEFDFYSVRPLTISPNCVLVGQNKTNQTKKCHWKVKSKCGPQINLRSERFEPGHPVFLSHQSFLNGERRFLFSRKSVCLGVFLGKVGFLIQWKACFMLLGINLFQWRCGRLRGLRVTKQHFRNWGFAVNGFNCTWKQKLLKPVLEVLIYGIYLVLMKWKQCSYLL